MLLVKKLNRGGQWVKVYLRKFIKILIFSQKTLILGEWLNDKAVKIWFLTKNFHIQISTWSQQTLIHFDLFMFLLHVQQQTQKNLHQLYLNSLQKFYTIYYYTHNCLIVSLYIARKFNKHSLLHSFTINIFWNTFAVIYWGLPTIIRLLLWDYFFFRSTLRLFISKNSN